MNFFNKLKDNFFKLNLPQQISVGILVLCVPALVALSVNALTVSGTYLENMTASSSQAVSESASEAISSSFEESSSEPESSSAQPIEIFLKSSSVEEDLEVQIVDADGNMVTGYDFILTVNAKSTSYTSTWTVNDGFLRLTKLDAGDYTVTISPAEGYIITEDTVECTVKEKVKYEQVDVTDKIKDETEIDVSKEDASLTKPVATPEPTPQLPTYEDKAAAVTKEITAYRYKANKLKTGDFAEENVGYLYNTDGTVSKYIAKIDENGYITGDIRVISVSSSSSAAASVLNVLSMQYSVLGRGSFLNILPLTLADTSAVTETDSNSDSTVSQESSSAADSSSASQESSSAIDSSSASQESSSAIDSSSSSQESSSASGSSSSSQESSSATDSSSASGSSSASSGSENSSGSESSSDSGSSSDSQKPSYDSAVKAEIYENNSAKILDSVEKTLDITADHETKDIYKNGWNSDKTSYHLADGSKVKGQAIIGSTTYNFDSDGNVVKNVAKGIDVSKYQPSINWAQVKASGVEYVIIRVGYRGYGSGVMVEDPYFKSHIAGARAAGLKVGVYFYSQAITVEEAVEEASMAIQLCNSYKLHYPIYFDTEATGTGVGRADNLSKTQRTAIANAFCQTVQNSGYKAGVYASKSWFYYQLDYSQLSKYDIWLAHYTTSTDFSYRYDMWQYTGSGSCPGISGAVDLNWAYKVY